MGRQQQEVEELLTRCAEYSHIISTKTSEVMHLKEENKQAQQNIEHLRGTLHGTVSGGGGRWGSGDGILHGTEWWCGEVWGSGDQGGGRREERNIYDGIYLFL